MLVHAEGRASAGMLCIALVFCIFDGAYASLGAFAYAEQVKVTSTATAFLALSRALRTNGFSRTVVRRRALIIGAFLTPFRIGGTCTGTLVVFATIALST